MKKSPGPLVTPGIGRKARGPLRSKLKKNHPTAAIIGECIERRDVSIVVE